MAKPEAPVITITKFGGLNLNVDPSNVQWNGAVDMKNLDLDLLGALTARPGFVELATEDRFGLSPVYAYEPAGSAGTQQYVYKAYDSTATTAYYAAFDYSDGSSVGTDADLGSSLTSARAVAFGTDTAQSLYIVSAGNGLYKWDGSTWTHALTTPDGAYVAVMPTSNRLVVGSGTGGDLDDSTLTFSDQGAPETFSDNTLALAPGDGSNFTGLLSWQDFVFAFKRGRYFVITGESEEDDGTPIFNYYTVDGFGSTVDPVAGDEGVYFFDGKSVWVTTGDNPKRISDAVDPFISGDVEIDGMVPGLGTVTPYLSYTDNKLYVAFIINTGHAVTLVYDTKVRAWTAYELYGDDNYVASVTSFHNTSGQKNPLFQLFVTDSGRSGVYGSFDPDETEDGGATAVAWEYQTGYISPADPYHITMRDLTVWGTGGSLVQVLTRGGRTNDATDSGLSLTLGAAPDEAPARHSRSMRGVDFALNLSGNGADSISRINALFRLPNSTRP